jgi:hypothetical protein
MAKKTEQNPAPDWYLKLEAKYLEAVARKQDAEEEIEKCKAALLGMMESDKLNKVSTDLTVASLMPESIGRKFNSTDFKKDYSDLYEKYATKYIKSSYVQVKVKEP